MFINFLWLAYIILLLQTSMFIIFEAINPLIELLILGNGMWNQFDEDSE